jgi:dipeptidyl aminopeptidase/acylaminoacyl peptidase
LVTALFAKAVQRNILQGLIAPSFRFTIRLPKIQSVAAEVPQERRPMQRVILASVLILASSVAASPQTKSPVAPADYGQWESFTREFPGRPDNGIVLSPDGKWLAYVIVRSNRNNELRITNIADGAAKVAAFGTQPVFSSDSRWVAYSVGYSEAQEEKMRKEKKPVHRKLGLLNLATGEQTVAEDIDSFNFSPTGTYLAMRHYPPEKKDKPDAATPNEADEIQSSTLIVRQLSTGHESSFANVSEYGWQDQEKHGTLLAFAINAEDRAGNGVQLFDSQTGNLRALDSAASLYRGLAWRKDSSDLAVLKSESNSKYDNPLYLALAWTNLAEKKDPARIYDPSKDAKFPTDMRTVPFRKPEWSQDGSIVFIGMAKWEKEESHPKKAAKSADGDKTADAKEEEEPAAVEVWHWRDAEVLPFQKFRAKTDAERNMVAAWHLDSGNLVQLGHDLTEEVNPLKNQKFAYAKNWSSYAMERSIGRPAADLYLINIADGTRTKVETRLPYDYYVEESPGGRYLLFVLDDNYYAVNVATEAVVNITKGVKTSFVDRGSDETVRQKPPFGVAGWTKDDASVILEDEFDLWQVAPDGSKATRLTDGSADQIRHRYVKLDRDEEFIDTEKPLYLSLFGVWSKKSGYAKLTLSASGTPAEEHLIWADKSVNRLAKAKDADVYGYTSETFVESPNFYVAGSDLKNSKPVTHTNSFQDKYAWGREELIEYKNSRGQRLQGALYYPAGYEPGKKYPMIVYMYEKLSDGLHHYSAPSERDYYNAAAVGSHGYLLLEPDIVFKAREPGVSVVDCVTAAVKKVIQMGVVDPKAVGVMGHSWGGFDSVYLATHTTNFFAAGVAGAPITDLVSNYGNHHWSIGIAETDHIETGQQRMEVPLYEDLPAYIRNSAVFNVQNMTTPLLIEVGDSDGTVFFHQGVELYNIARRAKKNVVLIEYAGEDHGLRKKPDQIDYHRRIFAWFDHYLKNETAATWITNGESYLDREEELKALKARE